MVLYGESHALIIGVSEYTAEWPDLPGVEHDIEAVQFALQQQGFHVIVETNPTRDQLDRVFTNFITQYGQHPDNRLVVYFAGHGHTLTLAYGGEMGYIVPIDAPNPYHDEAGFLARAMDMQQIEVYARRIQSKHALFVFDSCFSGAIFSLSRAVPENITYKTAEPVRQFITAGSAEEHVPDKSIFRQQFIAALQGEGDINGDGYVTGEELGYFLQDTVVNYSKGTQHPQYGKIRDRHLDKGDFVFEVTITVSISTSTTPSEHVEFVENFDDDRWAWSVRKSGEISDAYFDNGNYIIRRKDPMSCTVEWIALPFSMPENFDIELTSIWKSGQVDQTYGLVLGRSRNDYYVFSLYGNGGAKVYLAFNRKFGSSRPESVMIDYKSGKAFPGDGIAGNFQKIEARGDFFTYYVNNKYIGRVHNKELNFDRNDWRIGGVVCQQQEVAFDQLKITERGGMTPSSKQDEDTNRQEVFTGEFKVEYRHEGAFYTEELVLDQDGDSISGTRELTETDSCCTASTSSPITGAIIDETTAVLSWPGGEAECSGDDGCSSHFDYMNITCHVTLSGNGQVLGRDDRNKAYIRQ